MKPILLIGNFGAGNIGDEAILDGFLDRFPKNECIVISSNSEETKNNHKVFKSISPFPCGLRSFLKGIFSGDIFETLEEFKNCEKIVFPGGGLFVDPSRASWIWGAHFFLGKLFKKEILFYGQSVGPISGFFSRSIAKKVFKNADLIEVRDSLSKKFLEDEFNIKNVKIGKDSAFYLKRKNKKNLSKPKLKKIAICLKQDYLKDKELEKIAEELVKLEIEVTFIEMQKANQNEKGDRVDHKKIEAYLKEKKIKFKALSPKNTTEALECFSESNLVISSRLHGIIFAQILDIPFIAISNSRKIQGILDSLDKKSFSVQDLNPELFKKVIR